MQIITAPPAAMARPGSLLAAAYTPADVLPRLDRAGYADTPCGAGWTTYAVDCAATTSTGGVDETGRGIVSGMPFGILVSESCSTFGVTAEDYAGRARARMAAVESAAIARELWTGELATAAGWIDENGDPEKRLASPATIVLNGGTAVPFKRAVGLLEDALADMLSGEPGTIHMTVAAASQGEVVKVQEGANNLTYFGTRIVTDSGYTGTGPTGAAPAAGEAWLYGTARPMVRRSEVTASPGTLAEAIDRRTNRVRYTAERHALVTLACGVIAVRATL